MRDRLLRLSMARAALHWAGLSSLDAYGRATPAQLAGLGNHAVTVRRLVLDGRPDVLAALFASPSWHAATLAGDPVDRVLVIDGQDPVRYRADDPDSERQAWKAVKAVKAAGREGRARRARPRSDQGAQVGSLQIAIFSP